MRTRRLIPGTADCRERDPGRLEVARRLADPISRTPDPSELISEVPGRRAVETRALGFLCEAYSLACFFYNRLNDFSFHSFMKWMDQCCTCPTHSYPVTKLRFKNRNERPLQLTILEKGLELASGCSVAVAGALVALFTSSEFCCHWFSTALPLRVNGLSIYLFSFPPWKLSGSVHLCCFPCDGSWSHR